MPHREYLRFGACGFTEDALLNVVFYVSIENSVSPRAGSIYITGRYLSNIRRYLLDNATCQILKSGNKKIDLSFMISG